jgi:hypothetical protein
MLRLLALGSVLALACVGAAGATTTGGIYGKVSRGPVTPVCVAAQPCYVPAPGVILAFTRDARIVAHVESGAGGLYRIALAPGVYTVRELRPASALAPPLMKPVIVRVAAHVWTLENLVIDTSIR